MFSKIVIPGGTSVARADTSEGKGTQVVTQPFCWLPRHRAVPKPSTVWLYLYLGPLPSHSCALRANARRG